jgi:hypothetical protein
VHLCEAAQDTQLVALGIGEHHPAGAVVPALVVQLGGTDREKAGHLLVAGGGRRPQVDVQPVALDVDVAEDLLSPLGEREGVGAVDGRVGH